MKRICRIVFVLLLLAALAAKAQFTYIINPGGTTATIIGYTGNGQAVIPPSTNGLTVTSIGRGLRYIG